MSDISVANIDQFRQYWESNDQWADRRRFILSFRDNYSMDRVLCLSQVYANIKNLDCKYPHKVMIEVEELAKALKEKSDEDVEGETSEDAVPSYYTAKN